MTEKDLLNKLIKKMGSRIENEQSHVAFHKERIEKARQEMISGERTPESFITEKRCENNFVMNFEGRIDAYHTTKYILEDTLTKLEA